MHHLWRVRSVAVGNVKSWRRVSIPGWRWVWELLVASTVVYLQRPVVRVAHVHCSDHRGRWGMLQALVSQKARWVLSVCHRLQHRCYPSCCWHCLKPPGWWNLAEAGESPGSAGSLWHGSRAPHCCHFSQGYNIIITENIIYVYLLLSLHSFLSFFLLIMWHITTSTRKKEPIIQIKDKQKNVVPWAHISVKLEISPVVLRTFTTAKTFPEIGYHNTDTENIFFAGGVPLTEYFWDPDLTIVSKISLFVWDSWGWSYSEKPLLMFRN